MNPKPGDTIVVWFSCGAASAVAAKKTIELYGDICDVRIVNTPIAEEDHDNMRFLSDVSGWLDRFILFATNDRDGVPQISCVDIWNERKYMSGIKGAPCTQILKKGARQQYESEHRIDWHVFGFTAEEKKRHDNFVKTERENVLPILIDLGISKQECFKVISEAGIKLPRLYELGFPNANCIGCVKATSPTYWNHVRKHYPNVFAERAEQSRRIGCKLVRYKGKRIFLDELPPDAVGRPLKSMKMPECGLFCEEKTFY